MWIWMGSRTREIMAAPKPSIRHRRRLKIVAVLCGIFLSCCGLPLLWFVGNPFARIRAAEPPAAIDIPRGYPPHHHHAVGRDELVFLNRNSEIEVYSIDANLTRLRVVPIVTKEQSDLWAISAFPKSPRAVVSRLKAGLLIVNTETGVVERN